MMPWEFVIEKPEDLPVFADLLSEWKHPGEEVVRHLIKNNRFPKRGIVGKKKLWFWHVILTCYYRPVKREKLLTERSTSEYLPRTSFEMYDVHTFFTCTEAIWAVVNAGKYKPKKSS